MLLFASDFLLLLEACDIMTPGFGVVRQLWSRLGPSLDICINDICFEMYFALLSI